MAKLDQKKVALRERTFNMIKGKIEAGSYETPKRARRAIEAASIGFTQRAQLVRIWMGKYGRNGTKVQDGQPMNDAANGHTRTTKRRTGPKTRARGYGGDVNGSGEPRSVTLVRLLHHNETGEYFTRFIAKCMDEGRTLPEVHDEIQALKEVLVSR